MVVVVVVVVVVVGVDKNAIVNFNTYSQIRKARKIDQYAGWMLCVGSCKEDRMLCVNLCKGRGLDAVCTDAACRFVQREGTGCCVYWMLRVGLCKEDRMLCVGSCKGRGLDAVCTGCCV